MAAAIGASFGRAFCKHFGLNPGDVGEMTLHAAPDEVLHIKPTVFVDAEDLEAIALLMQQEEQKQ